MYVKKSIIPQAFSNIGNYINFLGDMTFRKDLHLVFN